MKKLKKRLATSEDTASRCETWLEKSRLLIDIAEETAGSKLIRRPKENENIGATHFYANANF